MWKDQYFLDLRVFFTDDTGTKRPTKRGVFIPADQLGMLRAAVDKAISTLEFSGTDTEDEEPPLPEDPGDGV